MLISSASNDKFISNYNNKIYKKTNLKVFLEFYLKTTNKRLNTINFFKLFRE